MAARRGGGQRDGQMQAVRIGDEDGVGPFGQGGIKGPERANRQLRLDVDGLAAGSRLDAALRSNGVTQPPHAIGQQLDVVAAQQCAEVPRVPLSDAAEPGQQNLHAPRHEVTTRRSLLRAGTSLS